jgi:hypothetical protein
LFVDILHLEDHFKCSVEHFVETLLLLSGAHHEALEGELLGSGLNLFVGDTIAELGLVALSLEFFAEIKLGANQDAGACACCCLYFRDPLLAGLLQRVSLHQTETDDEAVCVRVGYRAQTTEIFMTGCVPDLELNFASFVVLGSVVCVEHGGFVERWECLQGPSHNDRGFANCSVTNENELHVVLLVLVHEGFISGLHHFVNLTSCY